MTTYTCDNYRSRAYRGVRWETEVPLYENIGTFSAPVYGDGLDLDLWPFLLLQVRPEGLEGAAYVITGSAAYLARNPARVALSIPWEQMERAVVATPSGVELRPMRLVLKAGQADRSERTLLRGVIQFLPGGYTA